MKRFHLIFGSKDADIVYWMSFLPKKTFNCYVNRILKAELQKRIETLPIPEERGLENRKVDITLYFADTEIFNMLTSLPTRERSKYIKKIIRKHVDANYKRLNRISSQKQYADDFTENEQPQSPDIKESSEKTENPKNAYMEKIKRMTSV